MAIPLPGSQRFLYHPDLEHGACGVGFVADISGHRSHGILEKAIQSVVNLTHRGAVSADMKTGDGAGVLTQVPYKLLARDLEKAGQRLPKAADLAVGMLFLPRDAQAREHCQHITEQAVAHQGLRLLAWRDVPVDPTVLGEKALATQPVVRQVLLGRPDGLGEADFARALYLARKEIERQAVEGGIVDFYIPSLSHQTVVYKGLLVAPQLAAFYRDLQDRAFEVSLALFHQRYSTNTFPTWSLAQPFRFLGHNGEINTLQGNRNWTRAREPELQSSIWRDRIAALRPLIQPGGSDSANLDNVVEALTLSGRDLLHAMALLVPEAWENMPDMDPAWRAFYEYHACTSEPWDGPAALAFSDGVVVGACLDRNGLRPARYKVTDDGIVSMASEVGVIDIDDRRVIKKGRLGPGEMIAVDTQKGVLLTNRDIKDALSRRQPYAEWVGRHLFRLGAVLPQKEGHGLGQEPDLVRRQTAFAYSTEEVNLVLKPMFVEGKEPIGSMGDDTPLAVLSRKPRLLYDYFKQKFAQVTNPPIDPLREQLVMSLHTYLGARRSLLEESEQHAKLIHLSSPFLFNEDLARLRAIQDPAFRSIALPAVFPVADGQAGLGKGVAALCEAASRAVDAGHSILVLSDRPVDAAHTPIPMPLAVGAVHHHLTRQGKRMRASIVAETGEVREIHHYAVLLGYGASAINPYMALETIYDLVTRGEIENITLDQALKTYKKSVDAGVLKVMSKMGISALAGYIGAQIFEAIGLSEELVEECFTGTTSWVSGAGMEDLAREALARHQRAYHGPNGHALDDYGYYRFRRDGEYHANNPAVVRALHQAVASGKYEDYTAFASLVYGQRLKDQPVTLRDLLVFQSDREPIPLDQVEPAERIVRRFETAAMSLGALSPEAHDALTTAMNRLGARSNTGEGGEDPTRYHMTTAGGDSLNCKVKQVASARFGVTTEYLVNAETLQIKMAQGSKPGEGGQLPGHKVVEHIARLRHATPGVPLISPPPHHDIYSIEDLSQLIYDLKMVNPRARVNVKLVAEAGVGTIAAGVAKGYADEVLISGHDGGTGASPLSSIKNVGSPWELGLAETQQVLVMNDLRGRVILIADGGMKTGRDVVMAACFGAEGYGFGTMAVIAAGCKMARQ